jgi:hypothetical protein
MLTTISPPGYESRTTYQSEVDYLKNWVRDRSAWIDSQFLKRPSFSRPPGQITPGSAVTISANAGQTIYYTTNGSDPRLPGGAINPAAIAITSGSAVTVNSSSILKARVKSGTAWSAPGIAAYVTGTAATSQSLVITEFSYHPANPTASELASDATLSDDDFEYIELRNVSSSTLDLTGVSFTEGVRFDFPVGMTVAPGAYFVVVENAAAFALRYGSSAVVAGQYTGNLNNSADTIVLRAADGSEIIRFQYRDSWTPAADGTGYALTLRNPDAAPANYGSASSWGLSASANGSPGVANGPVFTNDFTLWQQSTFSEADLADPQKIGFLADADLDGASNLLEFACGTSPLDGSSHPSTRVSIGATESAFIYTRARQTLGLIYAVEQSTDLLTWSPLTGTPEITPVTGSLESVQVPFPRGAETGRYLRLRVTKAN